jgi:hypothetical protein
MVSSVHRRIRNRQKSCLAKPEGKKTLGRYRPKGTGTFKI